MKPWYQSKTVWLGVLQLAAAITLFVGNKLDGTPIWNPSEIVLLVNGIIMVILRWLTSQPITSFTSQFDKLRPKVMKVYDSQKGAESD